MAGVLGCSRREPADPGDYTRPIFVAGVYQGRMSIEMADHAWRRLPTLLFLPQGDQGV